ncbi:MAG: acyl-CoA dehydrogenase family protein [Chloroflexi bacterium]|nr:acyl-CoA dehydrogenase family protein [Chloroflexota bacterium]
MISFEIPESIEQTVSMIESVATEMMRPQARYYDDHEHEIPWDYINFMHDALQSAGAEVNIAPASSQDDDQEAGGEPSVGMPSTGYLGMAHYVEMLSWGDAGLYLCTPQGGLGAAAVSAAGTPEQVSKFLERFKGDRAVFSAMAITEPHAGSDTAAIKTTAVRDGSDWVLNGEKIFVTGGHKALVDTPGFVIVWATIDPEAGRNGIRSFVVEAGTPGCTVTKLEKKLGIRCSDTAAIVLQDCRVPLENMLGTVEQGKKTSEGYKGVLRTFEATRPLVGASALGIARAALEFLKAKLAEGGIEIRYGLPLSRMTNLEAEVVELEAMLRSAWLLTLRAVWMVDNKIAINAESSMSKIKAGDAVVKITQKAVELLGPMGYSREHLLEKWFRDAKINDLYEGTGQINRLIVARRILGYSRHELS